MVPFNGHYRVLALMDRAVGFLGDQPRGSAKIHSSCIP